jgi:hypothetical protein
MSIANPKKQVLQKSFIYPNWPSNTDNMQLSDLFPIIDEALERIQNKSFDDLTSATQVLSKAKTGTSDVWVAIVSAGAVTTKIRFIDGIFTDIATVQSATQTPAPAILPQPTVYSSNDKPSRTPYT